MSIEKPPGLAAQVYLSLIALATWFALAGQFYIYINSKAAPAVEIIARYFSFYTILTNIIIAVCCTALLLKPTTVKFFSRPSVLTAITVNITIVSLVYNLILRFLWMPTGFQHAVDEMLHLLIPLAFILFWLTFVPKGDLKRSDIFMWMIYPLTYLAFVLIRGALSGFYPYPFLNVKDMGFGKVLLNSGGIAVAFFLIALLYVAIDGWMVKKTT